jgi:hypothetical protein
MGHGIAPAGGTQDHAGGTDRQSLWASQDGGTGTATLYKFSELGLARPEGLDSELGWMSSDELLNGFFHCKWEACEAPNQVFFLVGERYRIAMQSFAYIYTESWRGAPRTLIVVFVFEGRLFVSANS